MDSRRYLVTSSKDKKVMVWDLLTYQCIAHGEGHADSVSSVGISQRLSTYQSKQSFIISAGMDKVIKRWNFHPSAIASSSTTLQSSHSIRAHEKDINSVAIAPNDSMIASGSQDKLIKLWKAADLSPIASLSGHRRGIWKLAFSPVDRSLVSASSDRSIKLWSMTDYSCLQTFEGHSTAVLTIRFINKGSQLISGSADGIVKLWTVRTGECENTFDEHQDRIWALATHPAHDHIFFSGSSDSSIHRWKDITAEEETKRVQALEEALVVEQQLQNDIRNRRYAKVSKCD
jgi:U3 small nucleolar RNA-associated protein 13